MGKNSGIEWTHHTFNPWWGCVKVSPACKHCYAETWARRVGAQVWGKKADRRFFSERHWLQPLLWNREAEGRSERRRVFCASMSDVFEDREDLDIWRDQLWDVIGQTPWLDWLLLTKRPENVTPMVPWASQWPVNVWLGTTAENQRWAQKRIPVLLSTNARVKFLSCEPMLGPISLTEWLSNIDGYNPGPATGAARGIQWVIAGGESGHGARPMHPSWVRQLRDQCLAADIAFHFKQWGNWRPVDVADKKSPRFLSAGAVSFERMSKANAGRDLDGRSWDEFPALTMLGAQ